MSGNLTEQRVVVQTEIIAELKDILEDEFPVLVTTYLDDAALRLDKLASAVSTNNAGSIRAEAHSLKGSSSNLGAVGLAQLCAEMEKRGAEEQLNGTANLLDEINSEFTRTQELLRGHL